MKTFKLINLGAALAMGAATLTVSAPASARDYYQSDRYERGDYYRGDSRRSDYNRSYRNNGRYYAQGDYYRGSNDNRRYRNQSAYRCNNDGTTGTIIGAIAGGLLGHEVAGRRGDRTAGTIIGGAVGALAGNAIDKSDNRCR